jgi:hypothetical protein
LPAQYLGPDNPARAEMRVDPHQDRGRLMLPTEPVPYVHKRARPTAVTGMREDAAGLYGQEANKTPIKQNQAKQN